MIAVLLAALFLAPPSVAPTVQTQTIIVLPTIADLAWEPVAMGDVVGDSDLVYVLWRHAQTGQNVIWTIKEGVLVRADCLPTVFDTNWKIVGVSQHAGILWHNGATGATVLWPMAGGAQP